MASPSAPPPSHSPASTNTIIPHIHLLCMQPAAAHAFTHTVQAHNLTGSLSYTIHQCALSHLDPHLTFDLVVSPANSYGILDGGFDDAISRAWSPQNDYGALTRALQADLYAKYRGFQSPGTCHLFRMPSEFRGRLRYNDKQGWKCKFLAHCPTMRVPSSCVWDREVVYECVWNLLCAVDGHNRAMKAARTPGQGGGDGTGSVTMGGERGDDDAMIRSILMTPLGTATGGVSNERWAAQTVLAIKHFIDAVSQPEKWSCLGWDQAADLAEEVEDYHDQ